MGLNKGAGRVPAPKPPAVGRKLEPGSQSHRGEVSKSPTSETRVQEMVGLGLGDACIEELGVLTAGSELWVFLCAFVPVCVSVHALRKSLHLGRSGAYCGVPSFSSPEAALDCWIDAREHPVRYPVLGPRSTRSCFGTADQQ